LLTGKRIPWGRIKPPAGTPLDWSKRINKGLVARCLWEQHGGLFWPEATGNYRQFREYGNYGVGCFGGPCLKPDGVDYAYLINRYANHQAAVLAYPITIVGWAMQDLAGNAINICAMADTASDNHYYLLSISASNTGRVSNGDPVGTSFADSALIVVPKVWYQFVGVWTSGADRKIYVNGRLEGSDTSARTTDPSLLDNTTFCALVRGSGPSFGGGNGKIDNVSIYNRVLTPSEILWLYNNPFGDFVEAHR
jgi:hypothetical protein